jgi:hypothetical protein
MKWKLLFAFLLFNLISFSQSESDSIKTICKRNYLIHSDKIIVTLRIEKPRASGFARIYEKIPSEIEIGKINGGTSVFKNDKNMLKFAWDNIPENEIIEITYEIKIKKALLDTMNSITGTFSSEFLPIEKDQISILPGTKEYIKKESLPIAVIDTKKEEKEIKEEKKIKKEVVIQEIKPLKKVENSLDNQPISSDSSVYICIQVAAVGKNIKPDYLKKQYGFEGEFESHFEENFYRITVGKFKSLAEAEAVLKEYKVKYFKKCFLSAYKDGHKIPVSEAEKLLN